MKKSIIAGLVVSAFTLAADAQTEGTQSRTANDRVVVTNTIPQARPVVTPAPLPKPAASAAPQAINVPQASNLNNKGMSFSQMKQKIAEARRHLTMRPLTIASVEPLVSNSLIRVAFYDANTRQIDSFVITKDQFLASGTATMAISSAGKQISSLTVRGNGVNTPLVIRDMDGRELLPLVVQYPRENRGILTEMAYYVSSHPWMITSETVNAGRFYVRNTIDIARDLLKQKGFPIQPKVADNAERLATVEHVDHTRFRTEPHQNIYNDIFTLYALNEGQTYRYSVSSAGAGGMVQMIPSTYRMVRNLHPQAGLMPDFVEGMRNHVNAAQAMLLYMQMTWNDLIANPTVAEAVRSGIATPEQLMAAGYNSNPAKLAGFINRGGADWTLLIPRETKIYLQIWDSLERAVPMTPRAK